MDLARPLPDGAKVEWVLPADPDGVEILRHSTAHVMAAAVKELFPGALITIGPAIENGFYYDFDVETPFTPEDLVRIEERMREIVKADHPFVREEATKEQARVLFPGEPYKEELLVDIPDETVSLYRMGNFLDLCRGPHVPGTGRVGAFRLMNTAGAYWRGDSKNRMLTRIYGVAFASKKELDEHLRILEEIKKRDHRKIGRELDLFSVSDDIGPGLILWHPKGSVVRRVMEDFWREEHAKAGYDLVFSPHIARLDLWRISGHTDFYRQAMFSPIDIEGQEYQLKPMNCPFHIQIYKSRMRSYRDLPIRYAELGTVYRYEPSGTLHGLLRVRGFTQDDAHLFLRPDQLDEEIFTLLDFTLFVLRAFGFERYDIYLSTRPEKYAGTLENWDLAESALRKALERKGLPFEVDPGEGVFYGPKIDIKIKDMLGRSWQCSTIQVDFNNPERFDATYVADDGAPRRAIMIHRALMGSLERFFGVLVEHYAGAFPVWLAPVQADVVPVTEKQNAFAREVVAALRAGGFRAEGDYRNEKLGYKIRESQMNKVPYALVVGEREAEAHIVSPRRRGGAAARHAGRGVHRTSPRGSGQPDGVKEDVIAKESRINEQIQVPEVRLVGPEGEQLGVVNTSEALQRARAQDLDLVEVAPMAVPPVCRIMDFGKFKYITSKREQEARKKQTVIQVKEIKVRPKTEEHDLNTKLKHIRRFLEEGDKVKVTVRFRGRELAYASQSGFEVLKHIVEAIADIAKVESAPKMEGKTMMAIVSPTMHKKKPIGGGEKPQAATTPTPATTAAPKPAPPKDALPPTAAPPAQKQEG